MAASAFFLYSANMPEWDWTTITDPRIKLVDSDYTPDFSANGDTLITAIGSNELTAAGSYAECDLATVAVADTAGDDGMKFSTANAAWTASGGNIEAWRWAVMYEHATLNGKANPLIGAFLGDATPANVPATTDGNTLTLTCPAGGWFDFTTDVTV